MSQAPAASFARVDHQHAFSVIVVRRNLAGQTANLFEGQDQVGTVVAAIAPNGSFYNSGGTVAAPSYSALGNTATGMFFGALNQLQFATAGVEALRMDANQVLTTGAQPPISNISGALELNSSSTLQTRPAYLVLHSRRVPALDIGNLISHYGNGTQMGNYGMAWIDGTGQNVRFEHGMRINNAVIESFRIMPDAANNRALFGINTTPANLPTVPLHVFSDTDGAFLRLERKAATAARYELNINTAGNFEVQESGIAARLRITTGTGLVRLLNGLDLQATNLQTDTVTGTQIGTAAAQKIGFYGVPTIVQPNLIGVVLTDNTAGAGTADTINAIAVDVTTPAKASDVRDALHQMTLKVNKVINTLKNLGLSA